MLQDLCITIIAGANGDVFSGGGGGRGVEGTVWASEGGGGGASGVDQARNSGAAHLYGMISDLKYFQAIFPNIFNLEGWLEKIN